MASANVSIRLSVEDADKVTAAFDKIGADGEASLQKLIAANNQLSSSLTTLDGKMGSLKSASADASSGYADAASRAKEFSGGVLQTAESIVETTAHLKLLAVAAYALSPAFRAVVNIGVARAFSELPTAAGLATQAFARLSPALSPVLSLFSRLTLPIGAAVVAWEGFNYVASQGADILQKYAGYERSLFGANVDSELQKLTKFQPDQTLSTEQIKNAIELATRLAEAKKNIGEFMQIQLNVNDPALRLQGIWVGIVGLIGDAAKKLNSLSMPGGDLSSFGNSDFFKRLVDWSKANGLAWQLPGTLTPAAPGEVLPGDRLTDTPADQMRQARARLAGGLPGGFVGRFTGDIDALANPSQEKLENPNKTDGYDREIEKIKQEIEQLNLQADGAGKVSREFQEMKVSHEANLAAMKAGIPVTAEMRDEWKELGDKVADATIRLKQAQALQGEKFKSDTMFMSPSDLAAANVAKSIDPTDWKSHIHDAAAEQAAFNTTLTQARDLSVQFGDDLVQSFMSGKGALQGLLTGVQMLERTFAQMAVKGLVNGLFGGLFGAGAGGVIPGATAGGNAGGVTFAMGGIMTSRGPLPLRRYAGGGIANSPQLAMFGEGSGPEAYVPLPDGRAIPVKMDGGRGATVNSNMNLSVTVPPGTSTEDTHRMAQTFARSAKAMVEQAVDERIITHMRTGGLLNPA